MDRIGRIERELRLWRCGFAAVAIGCVAGAGGDQVPDEIRAHTFVAVDEKGHKRISMGVFGSDKGPNQPSHLMMKDQFGNLRVAIFGRDDTAELHLQQGNSNHDLSDIYLASVRNQGSTILVQNGKRTLTSKVINSEASIEMKDMEGRARLGISLDMGKKPRIAGTNSDGDAIKP